MVTESEARSSNFAAEPVLLDLDLAGQSQSDAAKNQHANLVISSLWNAVRLGSGVLSSVLLMAMLARYLGTMGVGAYGYAFWLVGIVVFLGNFGLPITATRYIAECMGTGDMSQASAVIRYVIVRQCGISLTASGIGLMLIISLRVTTGKLAPIALMLIIGLRLVQECMIGVLLGKQQFSRAATVSVVEGVTKVGCVAGGIFLLHLSLAGLYVVISAATILSTLVALQMTEPRSWWNRGLKAVVLRRELSKRMWKFSALAAYSLVLNTIVWQRSEIFFLKHLSDLTQLGFYAAAFSIASILKAAPGVLSESLLPIASHAHRRGASGAGEIYQNGVLVVLALTIPLAILGIFFAGSIVELLYGPRFLDAVPVVQLLIASSVITSLGGIGWAVMYAAERQGFEVVCGTGVAILDILMAIRLIPQHGAMGAAAANSAAQVSAVLLTLIYLIRYMRLELPYRDMFRVAIAATLACGPAVMLRKLGLPLALSIGVAGVPLYFWLLRCFGMLAPGAVTDIVRTFWRSFKSATDRNSWVRSDY